MEIHNIIQVENCGTGLIIAVIQLGIELRIVLKGIGGKAGLSKKALH